MGTSTLLLLKEPWRFPCNKSKKGVLCNDYEYEEFGSMICPSWRR